MDASTTETRELTVEEAIAVAIAMQKIEQFAEAETLYRRILEVSPGHPDALHYSGILAHQQGRHEDAMALIEKSLALAPHRADWHSNLGNVLQSRGKLEEAIAAYERAIELDPQHANAFCNLGVLLRAQGHLDRAEASYRTAIAIRPEHIDAYTNLGILLNGQKRTEEAVACFCRVITLRPKHPDARRLLALAHCTVGEVDKAVQIYEEWLAEEPEEPVARHMLAACSGREVPSRASDGFVEKIFDNFAASFDSKLAKLSYRAPALVAAVAEQLAFPAKSQEILDAGCGTGLCGPLVAPFASRLTGIDLSAGMLAQAKDKNVYDELIKCELTGYLREHREAFDVIVSADTLVYFGNLEDVLAAAAGALRPGGSLIFTLEAAAEDGSVTAFSLETHGRYAHARQYVERLLLEHGLRCEMTNAELRMEAGTPVKGLVICATRPAMPVEASRPAGVSTEAAGGRLAGDHDV